MEEGFTGAFIEAFFTTVSLAPFIASLLAPFYSQITIFYRKFTLIFTLILFYRDIYGDIEGHF